MEFITSLLFDRPITLALLCAATCLVLLVLWRRAGTPGRRKAFWGAVAGSLVLLLLQAVLVTDRQRIVRLVETLAEAAERAEVTRIEESIDADYKDADGGRDALMSRIRDRLARYTIRSVSLSAFEVSVAGDTATAGFRVICDLRDRGAFSANAPSRWEVDLVRRGETWMVRSIRLLQLGPIKLDKNARGLDW